MVSERPTPARCPTCDAPAERCRKVVHVSGLGGLPVEESGWRFSLRAALEARVNALTRNELMEHLRQIRAIETRSRDDIRDEIAARVRAALLRVLAPTDTEEK